MTATALSPVVHHRVERDSPTPPSSDQSPAQPRRLSPESSLTTPASPACIDLTIVPSPAVVFDLSRETVCDANDAAGELFDYDPSALIGRDLAQLHPGDELSPYRDAYQNGVDRCEYFATGGCPQIVTAEGDVVPVTLTVRHPQATDATVAVGIFQERSPQSTDISSPSPPSLASPETVPVPTITVTPAFRITGWNQAAETMFGYAKQTMLGNRCDLFVNTSDQATLHRRVLAGETLHGYETQVWTQDGSMLDVSLYARPLSHDGEITEVVITIVDTNDDTLRRKQLSVLNRILRHNLSNQLILIQNFADRLRSELPIGSKHRTYTDRIVASAEKLMTLRKQSAQIRQLVNNDTQPLAGADSRLVTIFQELQDNDWVTDAPPKLTVVPPSDPVWVPEQAQTMLTWLLRAILRETSATRLVLDGQARLQQAVVVIRGNRPLVPESAYPVLTTGTERPTQHEERLDFARVAIAVDVIGGRITIADQEPDGASLRLEIPRTRGADATTFMSDHSQ